MVTWKVKGFFKADAEAVYSEIVALGDSFSPEAIVEAAKDEDSELHKCFEWDDTKAAQKYREHQARVIVASLVIITKTSDNETAAARVISSTGVKNEYKPTVMLVKVEQEYIDLLARAKRELQAIRNKYKVVEELREIFEAIDEL